LPQHRLRLLSLAILLLLPSATGIGVARAASGTAVAAASSFPTSATVASSSAPGSSTTIKVGVTPGASATVLVDLEVANASGNKVFQKFWDSQSLGAGAASAYSADWQIPASQPAGTYTVNIGIFTPGWGSLLTWNQGAAQFQVTGTTSSTSTFSTMAAASPSTVKAGTDATLTAQVTSSAATTVLVDLEVYDPTGNKVFQQFWDAQSLNAQQGQTYAATWSVPSSQASGNYALETGIFVPGWGTTLAWNGSAGEMIVSAANSSAPIATPNATSVAGLQAQGNQLLNGDGQTVRLHGVNRSGTEYACIQGWGIFDGPSDAASVTAIGAWKANAIRVPLNEDCWLGINGVPAAYSGAAYQQAITAYVNTITAAGMAAILDLHWTAPGSSAATAQQPMPDLDHAPLFWSQVAGAFNGNSSVVFELFNEPFPDSGGTSAADWACWRDGGNCTGVPYQAAGMQTLVNAVRQAGANNLILVGGLAWSNSLTQWLNYEPSDPAHNLAAAWHVYNFNVCSSSSCYDSQVAPVAANVPVVATEIGENDCSGSFISPLMNWLDAKGQSYAAWTWDNWGSDCGAYSLVSGYGGMPTSPYGQTYHNHLAVLP